MAIASSLVVFSMLPFVASALQCYAQSNLQVVDCPSVSCIKQTHEMVTIRYCDGSGASSVCQTYRIFETCDNIPNLGYICCCSGNLCNSTSFSKLSFSFFLILLWRLL